MLVPKGGHRAQELSYLHLFCFQVGETEIVNGKEPRGREKF